MAPVPQAADCAKGFPLSPLGFTFRFPLLLFIRAGIQATLPHLSCSHAPVPAPPLAANSHLAPRLPLHADCVANGPCRWSIPNPSALVWLTRLQQASSRSLPVLGLCMRASASPGRGLERRSTRPSSHGCALNRCHHPCIKETQKKRNN